MGSLRKIILGAGGLAKEVLGYYFDLGQEEQVIGFAEENSTRVGQLINGKPIYDVSYLNLLEVNNRPLLTPAIGSTKRARLIKILEDSHFQFDTVVHPSAVISKWSSINTGTVVAPGVVITSNVFIGKYVYLNLCSSIGHDSIIGNFTTISPGARISGHVNIGNQVFVGNNASINEGITIGDGAVIASGSAVIENVPSMALVAGVPARVKKIYQSEAEKPW